MGTIFLPFCPTQAGKGGKWRSDVGGGGWRTYSRNQASAEKKKRGRPKWLLSPLSVFHLLLFVSRSLPLSVVLLHLSFFSSGYQTSYAQSWWMIRVILQNYNVYTFFPFFYFWSAQHFFDDPPEEKIATSIFSVSWG